ncbi:stage II sporulation protein M [Kallotenue papyrolyticum]|uniref:stage II sporulation protein M n=1 Tax=Kallotenue papyrolyticum TaxID=1325125 RepID=UPI0004785B2F|nr:stage II sporulation protein M [Kallotenue papyrolyticum]
MTLSMRLVVRREMRDSLTDWRMMFPIVTLTFVVPLLIVAAALAAIDFIDDDRSVARLVPFGLLLAGFLPASFSLITALESFVGEKERNTLESLLATPMSDGELYLGKLIAALTLPLLSALMAMGTYLIALGTLSPPEIIAQLNPRLLWLMLALIVVKAIVMVAGAVIISTHTTTIRAANLLASFVLVPMSVVVQLEALVIIAQQRYLLWNIFWALLVIAFMLVRSGMNSFNREAILSREHAGFDVRRSWWSFRQFLREYRPAGVPPEARTLPFSARRFYRHELPALLHDYRAPLAVAFIGAMSGLIFGLAAFGEYRAAWLDSFLRSNIGDPPPPSPALALAIAANNLRVAVLSNLLSMVSFGVFAFLVPTAAFAQIGYVAAWHAAHGLNPSTFVLAYVVPHGLIELPVFLLSSALGIRIGAALLYAPRGFSIGQNLLWSLANFIKTLLLLILPLTLLAALIEGLITPQIIRLLYG